MAYDFKQIKDMDESHLLNTISCISSNISEQRKQECRNELVKRWYPHIIEICDKIPKKKIHDAYDKSSKKKPKKRTTHISDSDPHMVHDLVKHFIKKQD